MCVCVCQPQRCILLWAESIAGWSGPTLQQRSAPLSNTRYNPASRSECVDVCANTAAFLASWERLKCWLTFPVRSSQKKRIIKDIHTIYGYGLREKVRSRRSTYKLNECTARKSRKSSCRLLPFPFPSHFFALPFLLSLSPSLPPAHCEHLWNRQGKKILRKIYTRSKINTHQAPNAWSF